VFGSHGIEPPSELQEESCPTDVEISTREGHPIYTELEGTTPEDIYSCKRLVESPFLAKAAMSHIIRKPSSDIAFIFLPRSMTGF
jgi:hypothetical protein